MTEGIPEKPKPKRIRKWLRRLGCTLLGLVLILVVFHRPILKGLIHAVAIKVAAKQHIALSLDVEGTILTNISLKNIHALPLGNAPSPVTRISIDEVTVEYSIPSLIRHGVQEFLKSYTLRNADIEVKPVEGTPSQKSDLASTLHGLIQQPALFSDRVDIENINLVAHTDNGDFALQGLSLLLDPVKTGELRIARLEVPKIRTWENLHGTTTYANRDFILRNFALDPQIIINPLELDASQRARGVNRLAVNGTFFGGAAQFSIETRELGKKKIDVQIHSELKDFSLAKVSEYFGAQAPALGSITESKMDFGGDPNVPASWSGTMISGAGPLKAGGISIDKVVARLDAKEGTATLNLNLNSSGNRIDAQAQAALPQTLDGFAGTDIHGTLTVAADKLPALAAQLTDGRAKADGTFTLHDKLLTLNLKATASKIAGSGFDVNDATFSIDATKSLATTEQPPAPFDGLQTQVTAHFADIRASQYAIDSGDVRLVVKDARVQLEKLDLVRAQSTIHATADYTLPRDMQSFATAPLHTKFAISIPNLTDFNAEPTLTGPNAEIEANGAVSNGADGYNGNVDVAVTKIAFQDFAARSFGMNVTIAKNVATIGTLEFSLNDTDGFSGTGHVDLRQPFPYDGQLQANIRDLSKFNAFVQNLQGGLAGSLSLTWAGSGQIANVQHSGDVHLSLSNGKAAGVQAINVGIGGHYSPEVIDLPTFWVTSSKGDFAAVIGLKENALTISQIAVKQAGKQLLSGSVSLPLDLRTPKNPESIVPLNGPISANIVSSELVLDSFFPKEQAPVKGTAKATLTASGTIEQLDARLQIAARNLQAKAAAKLAPAALDLDMRVVENKLSLKGRVTQPAIQPVEIAGTLPLPIQQIVQEKKIDPQSPIQLSIRLPRSSVAFINQVTPAVRYVEGTASVKVDVAGTIAKPELSGSTLLDLPAIRMANQDLPAISGFHGDLRFEKNRLTVNRLGGDISGGAFNAAGNIQLTDLTKPVFDLRLTSNDALLLRNESVTVRADTDIRVTGPLNAATVAGTVGITHSKFFREIDILPIQLPGRPAPKPPSTSTGVSFPNPPLRDWKFDVAIKTKDPFKVKGNLANGSVNIDLALVGTGRAPTLDGQVRIENFVASLPFSKLEVNYGYVYFSPDAPFEPRLDIQATSSMRDYNINVYIFGTASDPQTIMSAEPPLPQEDIIALLATGSTASELTGSGDVIAGRAASLLFQKLYRTVFKAKEPSENESFLSRFSVDVGVVDPRTGQQEVSTRFKVADKFYLIGDLDVGGNIRGQVKYLLRFR